MNIHLLTESLGWIATAVFALSYLCKNQGTLRLVQAVAATLWIAYGFSTGSLPVVVSNAAVAFMAVAYPWLRRRSSTASQRPALKHPPYEQLPDLA